MTLGEIKAALCTGQYSSFNLHWNADSATNYETVATMFDGREDYYAEDRFVGGAAEKALCAETNSIWTAHWYPKTPVGFHVLHASTYEKLHAALQAECVEKAGSNLGSSLPK